MGQNLVGLQALDVFKRSKRDSVVQSVYHRQQHGDNGSHSATLWSLVADGPRNVSISARNVFYSCPLVERAGSHTGAASVWEVPMHKVAGQAPVNHGAKAAARAQLFDAWRAMMDAVCGSMLPPPPAPALAAAPAGGPSKRRAETAGAHDEWRSSRHRPREGAD
jgi:hypothetical protein